jgi:hypothetical protein
VVVKSPTVWKRIGTEPDERLQWLLHFGVVDPASLNTEQAAELLQEARAFVLLHQTEPEVRPVLRIGPPPVDETPGVLTPKEAQMAQVWFRSGLELLHRGERWNFAPRIVYEVDLHKGRLWVRMRSSSPLQQFKAAVYEALQDARFKFRLCPECTSPFVVVRRQLYCSRSCSQAVRTRKWRKAHPDKNRAVRRAQYKQAKRAKLGVAPRAAVRIGRGQRARLANKKY